jgi:hypothetical protein
MKIQKIAEIIIAPAIQNRSVSFKFISCEIIAAEPVLDLSIKYNVKKRVFR